MIRLFSATTESDQLPVILNHTAHHLPKHGEKQQRMRDPDAIPYSILNNVGHVRMMRKS